MKCYYSALYSDFHDLFERGKLHYRHYFCLLQLFVQHIPLDIFVYRVWLKFCFPYSVDFFHKKQKLYLNVKVGLIFVIVKFFRYEKQQYFSQHLYGKWHFRMSYEKRNLLILELPIVATKFISSGLESCYYIPWLAIIISEEEKKYLLSFRKEN